MHHLDQKYERLHDERPKENARLLEQSQRFLQRLCLRYDMNSHVAAKTIIVLSKGRRLRRNSLEPDGSKQGGWGGGADSGRKRKGGVKDLRLLSQKATLAVLAATVMICFYCISLIEAGMSNKPCLWQSVPQSACLA